MENQNPEIIIYKTEDGLTQVDVAFQDDTVWLTQEQMAELFQKAKSTINEHIANIYKDGELQKQSTMRKFGNSEFSTKPTNYYNLDEKEMREMGLFHMHRLWKKQKMNIRNIRQERLVMSKMIILMALRC